MSDKTYVIYFEGQIEIEADVGYYKIYEYECRHLGSVQYEGTSDH